ncbi:MAG: hypothetical protein Aurels2KO_42150 [Aureliella sp.]
MITAALAGCRGRARDDIYIETMAAEIRDLEDQCYEYDYEYRRLEQENADLQRRLANAERKLQSGDDSSSRSNNRPPSILNRDASGPSEPPPFIPPSSSAPTRENSIDSLPAPGASGNQPGRLPDGMDNSSDGFNDMGDVPLDDLQPPTIEFGSPSAPPVSVLQDTNPGIAPEDDLELNLARVQVPALAASHQTGIDSQPPSDSLPSTRQPSRLIPAAPKVTDRRIVELAFHPVLSRSIDLDGKPGDDGVFLVLQPKNQLGQMVDEYAKLTVVVLDPALPEDRARIGFREYSPAEVKAKMTPIGAQAGIHLQLPWNGPNPRADRVIVFAKYTFSNEQEVIGSRDIMLTSDAQMKMVWTPRHPSGGESAPPNQPQFAAQPPRSNVVRPAAGTGPISPAPAPSSNVQPASGFSLDR